MLNAVRNGQPIDEVLTQAAEANQGGQPKSRLNELLSEDQLASKPMPPPISVVNLSYTYIGNKGIELLSDVIYAEHSALKTIDFSFCGIDEKGFIALAKALQKRKRKGTNVSICFVNCIICIDTKMHRLNLPPSPRA